MLTLFLRYSADNPETAAFARAFQKNEDEDEFFFLSDPVDDPSEAITDLLGVTNSVSNDDGEKEAEESPHKKRRTIDEDEEGILNDPEDIFIYDRAHEPQERLLRKEPVRMLPPMDLSSSPGREDVDIFDLVRDRQTVATDLYEEQRNAFVSLVCCISNVSFFSLYSLYI